MQRRTKDSKQAPVKLPSLMNLLRKKESASSKNSSKRNDREQTDSKASKKKKKKKTDTDYVQDIIGIEKVIGNVIFMSDGTVAGLLEILPINYYQRTIKERNLIIEEFESLFRVCPNKLHIKVRTEDSNIDKTIEHIKKCTRDETDPAVLDQVEDYIAHIKRIQGDATLCQKFYVIYEYEGDIEGKRSTDVNEIYAAMMEMKYTIMARFQSIGHIVVDTENEVFHTCEVLYKFFNPNSSITEPFIDRYIRMSQDMKSFNESVPEGRQRVYNEGDYVAPRGIDFKKSISQSYFVMDGQYHTYLSIRDNGYPGDVPAGWLNVIGSNKGVDIDIILQKVNRDHALSVLQQYSRINNARANLKINNPEKYEELSANVNNVNYITRCMRTNDEDLFEVVTIITIRDNSYQRMMSKKNAIIKNLQSYSIYTNDSFLTVKQYFDLTMPLMKFDSNILTSVFSRDKHNFLTSSLATLYCFTAYELYDETGYVMGRNPENYTLVALNNFNTFRYSNGNMCLIGTSGAGKTFTSEMLAYRMRMSGIRAIFIAPIKGREDFYSGCMNIGGAFITLSPKSRNCINIMAIRPAAQLSDDELAELENEVEFSGRQSLLEQRITSIMVFVQLLMGKEKEEKMTITERTSLSLVLNKLYEDFGITNDDRSIWKNRKKRILKDMPIIEDLYNRVQYEPDLYRVSQALIQCVEGSCQALNGQTNVDLSNKYIVFDVNGAVIDEELLPAFMYIAFDCAKTMAQESNMHFDAIFLDEVWKMMVNEACAKQVKEMVKLIRAYAACVILSTQDLEDFLHSSGGFGASVINNTEIKMFLKLSDKEIDLVSEQMHFTEKDRKALKKLHHQALIYSNGDKILCDLMASEKEQIALTTDANVRIRQKERERASAPQRSQLKRKKKKSVTV